MLTKYILNLFLGSLFTYKGILIGIYDSPYLFVKEHFGTVFSKNFAQTEITQKAENGSHIENVKTEITLTVGGNLL